MMEERNNALYILMNAFESGDTKSLTGMFSHLNSDDEKTMHIIQKESLNFMKTFNV
jgi:hypothetical protein